MVRVPSSRPARALGVPPVRAGRGGGRVCFSGFPAVAAVEADRRIAPVEQGEKAEREQEDTDQGNGYPGFFKNPKAVTYLWASLAAAYLLDPGFVTKQETMRLNVVTEFGPRYGLAVEAPGGSAVRMMLDLDNARVFSLIKKLLTANSRR